MREISTSGLPCGAPSRVRCRTIGGGAPSSHQQGRAVLLVLGPCIESFVRRFNEIDEYSFAASGVEHLCAAGICEWSALHETRDELARSNQVAQRQDRSTRWATTSCSCNSGNGTSVRYRFQVRPR